MAIFNNNDNEQSVEPVVKGATVIAAGTKFKGDMTLKSSSLHIDGEIEGNIHSDNSIIIGAKGQVDGEIVAKKIVINGIFKGSAESEVIDILPRGNVKGKLVYAELTIEKGAAFEGETLMRSVTTASRKGESVSSKGNADNKLELLPSNGNTKKHRG